MKTSDVISLFGNQSNTARELTKAGWPITPQAVQRWDEHPPLGRQYQIEAITNGELKADPSTATEK